MFMNAEKTVKPMNHIKLFLDQTDQTSETQTNMLLLKTYLFVTLGKILNSSIKTINLK